MRGASERAGIAAIVVIVVLTVAVLARIGFASRAELAAAENYERDGQTVLAIDHYRRAARWSLPLSPHRARAVVALQSIGRRLESEGDVPGALMAWRSLSGALAATRFAYSGVRDARKQANDQIARLMASDRSAAIDAGLSAEQLAVDHRRLLDHAIAPDPWWGTLLILGMATWVGSLALLAWRGFDAAGRFRWVSAKRTAWAALVGLISFVLGLLLA